MEMIEPSLNAKVIYFAQRGALAQPSTITSFVNHRMISIKGTDPSGKPFTAEGISLLQESDNIPHEGEYAIWDAPGKTIEYVVTPPAIPTPAVLPFVKTEVKEPPQI